MLKFSDETDESQFVTFRSHSKLAQEILTQDLEMRQVCARWVPRLLQPVQKTVRVEICKAVLLKKYSAKADQLLVTKLGYTFIEPESKQQSSLWKHRPLPSQLEKSWP